jgi:hypothetical protein
MYGASLENSADAASDVTTQDSMLAVASASHIIAFFEEMESIASSPRAHRSVVDHFDIIEYEPMRHNSNGGPPKRFYRTFWRAMARRLCKRAIESVAERIKKLA